MPKLDPDSRARLAIAAQIELPSQSGTAILQVAVPEAVEITPVTPILVHGCGPLESDAAWTQVDLPGPSEFTR